jgi:glycosyltransferase involved in cell wall biosynthesis
MEGGNRLLVARQPQADVLHHTWYDVARLHHRRPKARVCTIYDMIPELLPERFGSGNPHEGKTAYIKACDGILCISETTQRDLQRLNPGIDVPVAVVPLATGEAFHRPGPPTLQLPDEFILFVGVRSGYKNFSLVAAAMALLAPQLPDLHLVCVGGGAFTDVEAAQFEATGLAGRVSQRTMADEQLASTYAAARAFVFASRYEGFGLPLLEAFASGCPTVIASTPCLLEVSGGAADVVDPDKPAALAETLARLTRDEARREKLTVAGRARVGDFSWRRTAQATADLYREVLRR